VEHGADVNKEDQDGETPLFKACSIGNEAIVKYLIKCGVDVNKRNRYNETPYTEACRSGNKAIIKMYRKKYFFLIMKSNHQFGCEKFEL